MATFTPLQQLRPSMRGRLAAQMAAQPITPDQTPTPLAAIARALASGISGRTAIGEESKALEAEEARKRGIQGTISAGLTAERNPAPAGLDPATGVTFENARPGLAEILAQSEEPGLQGIGLKQLLTPEAAPKKTILSPGQVAFGSGGEEFASVPATPPKSKLLTPEEFEQAQALRAAGKTDVTTTVDLGKGQTEADKKAAADFNEFVLQGGAADSEKGILQLTEVRDNLRGIAAGTQSGNLTGALLGFIPPSLRASINPESVNQQELVEEVVQRNLRLVLGAQFTENEGKRLIARSYNPKLDEATNADRLDRLLTSMQKAHNAKLATAAYFQENGTLAGYDGLRLFGKGDVERDAFGDSKDPKPEAQDSGLSAFGFSADDEAELNLLRSQ